MNTVGYSFWRKHDFTDYMHIMYRDLPEVGVESIKITRVFNPVVYISILKE